MLKEINKIVFKTVHMIIAIIFLIPIAIYIFENNILSFDSYADVYAIIPSEFEFENDDKISFLLFSENNDGRNVEVDVRQNLMCDYGISRGYGLISSHESKILLRERAPINAITTRSIVQHIEEGRQILSDDSVTLQELASDDNLAEELVFSAPAPSETSQCFMKFKFTKMTPYFSIPKEYETSSYPFDFVWYFSEPNITE